MDSVTKKQLTEFFECKFELSLEKYILNNTFDSHRHEVISYIEGINRIPICEFIEYIRTYCKRQPIMAADVFQFSDFDDATINLCTRIIRVGNNGLKFKDIARLLLADDVPRNDIALNKYGENHIKTAESMGLAFKDNSKTYYLSANGCVFIELPEDSKQKFLLRLIIRNKLITQLFLAAIQGPFDMEAFLYDLSKSTYVRRRTNINRVLEILKTSQEYDFSQLIQNIKY